MKTYTVHQDYFAKENSIIDVLHLSDFVDIQKYRIKNACINTGGWQSWNPCTEVFPEKKQPSLTCHIINQWNSYLVFPQSKQKPSKNIILGQFVSYLRWENLYLVFASVGNVNSTLPPVQFIFNRAQNTVSIEICDKGNEWKSGDVTARIEIFTANSFFECKEKLAAIFDNKHFESVSFLGDNPAGWESWYNHYANINEALIREDLKKLASTDNIISLEEYSSKIFQIDDGWEKALGDWDENKERFPNAFCDLTKDIEDAGYIPGLWIAPFIIDARSKSACEHPSWLLRDEKGILVPAGYNPLWGKKGTFYCLDLSNDEVITHLDSLMNKIINTWGFRYIKLDFLYAGMLWGNYSQKTAGYKIFTRALKTITARKSTTTGKPVAYLGCGCPFELSFKYLPLSRIGCDTLEKWKNPMLRFINWNGRNEAYLNLKDTIGHALWNNTIFLNDPDVVFVRDENCTLNKDQKYLIAAVNSLLGSQLMFSDDPGNAKENEIALSKEIIEFRNKYKEEEFEVVQTDQDYYSIKSKSGKYIGYISLKDNSKFFIEEKK